MSCKRHQYHQVPARPLSSQDLDMGRKFVVVAHAAQVCFRFAFDALLPVAIPWYALAAIP